MTDNCMLQRIVIGSVLALCCLSGGVSYAQSKYSNEFLNLGVGARALAMSGTQSASVSDVTSAYWNPAGLSMLAERQQLFLMHAAYYAGVAAYDYAGWAYRLDERQGVAVNVMRFAVDDIPNTTMLIDNQGNINYDRISYFTSADWAVLLGYGRTLNELAEGLSVGGTAKIIRRRIGDFAGAWGFGLDAGLHYTLGGHWQFGFVARDVTTTFNAWSHTLSEEEKEIFLASGNELPENGIEYTRPHFSLGAAYRTVFKEDFSALVALDADIFCDGRRHALMSGNTFTLDPHFGFEVGYREIVFLRAGVGNIQRETDWDDAEHTSCQINFGLGVRIKKRLDIDYALTDLGDLSLAVYAHLFSLKLLF